MRISTRGRYALEAMLALTLLDTGKPVSIGDICAMTDLPRLYLEHLFTRMKQAGLVLGRRGSLGGYRLSAGPESLTAGQVLEAAEGVLSPVLCSRTDSLSIPCERAQDCRTRPVWQGLDQTIASFLSHLTLSDLAGAYQSDRTERIGPVRTASASADSSAAGRD